MDLIKKHGEVQKRTDRPDDAQKINDIEQRINKLDKGITYNTVEEKTKELKKLQLEVAALLQNMMGFEKNLSTHVKKPKKNIGEMLNYYKNDAQKVNDPAAVEEIETLEQELAAMPEELPKSQKELIERVAKLKNIKESIPQIKATLDKATTLKNIAEQVDADFAEVFDNIIKEIEAADSVEKVKLAEETLQNAEITLKGLMRTKINEAKWLYHVATKLGVRNLEVSTLRLIEDASGIDSLEEGSIDKIKQLSAGLNKIGQDIKNYLGKKIDDLVAQANELKKQAHGVDNKLYGDFNTTATNLAADKDELLKNLTQAAQTITNVRTNLAKYQGDLVQKLALKKQIDDLKEQATKLAELLKGKGIINNVSEASFSTIKQALEKINLSDMLSNITKKTYREKRLHERSVQTSLSTTSCRIRTR